MHVHRVVLVLAAALALTGGRRSEKPAAPSTPEPVAQPAAGPATQATTQPATAPATRPAAPGATKAVARGIRGIWVTRMDYKTAEDVTAIMENCRQAGFNQVVFQVRGNGTVFYPSKIEPWAEQFDFRSPGFDRWPWPARRPTRAGLRCRRG
jgi:uncharacterized lipoprotein YddW (UPF0748 family)